VDGRIDSEPETGDSVPPKKEFAINEPMRPTRRSEVLVAITYFRVEKETPDLENKETWHEN